MAPRRRRVLRPGTGVRQERVHRDATGRPTPRGAHRRRRWGGETPRGGGVVSPGDSKPRRRRRGDGPRPGVTPNHVRLRQVVGGRAPVVQDPRVRRVSAVRHVPAGSHHELAEHGARRGGVARVELFGSRRRGREGERGVGAFGGRCRYEGGCRHDRGCRRARLRSARVSHGRGVGGGDGGRRRENRVRIERRRFLLHVRRRDGRGRV